MAKKRTPEEMKKIQLNCARIMHEEGEAAVLAYLGEKEHYATPKATWWYIQKDEAYQKIVKTKAYLQQDPPEEEKPVVLNGTEFTRMKPEDLPATDEAPVILETEPITLDTVPTEPSEVIQKEGEEEKTEDEEITSAPMADEEYVQQLMETFGADQVTETDDVSSAFDNTTEAVNNLAGAFKKTYKEPPLGLMPKYVWIRLRIKEILKALARYHDAGMITPLAWIEELAELEDFSAEIFLEDRERDAE